MDDLSAVISDATYNNDATAVVAGQTAVAPAITGDELTWSGALAPGQSVSITYSVTVDASAVGKNLVNHVAGEVTPPGGGKIVPPPVTTDNPVNVPGFSVSKSANPETGTAVDPGSIITYTVTGVNTGETVLEPAEIKDDLSGVLAHAQYNGDVAASVGTALVQEDELSWNGSLQPGEEATITYSVTVNPDAGGTVLENTVIGRATPPGDTPVIETPPSRTEHPVKQPGFAIEKSADPVSGTAVDPGSVITYTFTGINTGQTLLNAVSIEDDLSQVLSHADFNGDAVASAGDVVVENTSLAWNGELAVGERVTIM